MTLEIYVAILAFVVAILSFGVALSSWTTYRQLDRIESLARYAVREALARHGITVTSNGRVYNIARARRSDDRPYDGGDAA